MVEQVQYAKRQLVRGPDGLLQVAYVNAQTGQPIPREKLSKYRVINNTGGNYWSMKDKKHNGDKDDKKKKKDEHNQIVGHDGWGPVMTTPGTATTPKTSTKTGTSPSTSTTSTSTSTEPGLETDNPYIDTKPNDGLVRSLESPDSTFPARPALGEDPVALDRPTGLANTRIASKDETPAFVTGFVQPTNERTLGLMEESNRPTAGTSVKGFMRDLLASEGTLNQDGTVNWNATLANGKFTNGPVDLTGMTVGEVKTLQSGMLSHPANKFNSSAVGAFQITRQTLNDFQPKLGISDDDLFTPDVQVKFGQAIYDSTKGNPAALKGRWEGLQQYDNETISKGIQEGVEWPTTAAAQQAPPTLPGVINGPELGFTNPEKPSHVTTTTQPGYTEANYLASMNPDTDIGLAGNTTSELGFRTLPSEATRNVNTMNWNKNGQYGPQDFGDYFNPENLNYDPKFEQTSLDDPVNKINASVMTNERYPSDTPWTVGASQDLVGLPQDSGFSQQPNAFSSGDTFTAESNGPTNLVGDSSVSSTTDPSGNSSGGFGSSNGGNTTAGLSPNGPNVNNYSYDGGFHSTTPSNTPSTPDYSDHGFHSAPSTASTPGKATTVNSGAPTSSENSYNWGGW